MTNNTATLTGYTELTVNKRDGTSEVVRVRELPAEELPKFQTIQDDEIQMCDFVCGKTAGWSKTLTNASHEQLVAEIEKVNGDFFGRWQSRLLARQERAMPGLREKLMERLLASRLTSPKSPSSAA